jgi:hypothetical protein
MVFGRWRITGVLNTRYAPMEDDDLDNEPDDIHLLLYHLRSNSNTLRIHDTKQLMTDGLDSRTLGRANRLSCGDMTALFWHSFSEKLAC